MKVGKLAGAVGVYGGGDPEMERVACGVLGLMPEPAATQVVPRDRHAELLSALALCGDVPRAFRHRDQASRPHGGGRGPRALRQGPEGLFGDAAQAQSGGGRANLWPRARRPCSRAWSGRKTSHSGTSATFHTRAPSGRHPDAFLALDYMLDRFAWLVDGLVVDAKRMRANLESSHGLVFSQRVLSALVASGLAGTRPIGSCSATHSGAGTRASRSTSSSSKIPRSAPDSIRRVRPGRCAEARRRSVRASCHLSARKEEAVHA